MSYKPLNILVVTAAPALPQMVGGSQRTSHALIRGLIERGHRVELLAGFRRAHWIGIRSRLLFWLTGAAAVADRYLGYKVWRSWSPWDAVAEVIEKNNPDLVLVLAHKPTVMAKAALKTGTPVLLALQDVEFDDQGSDYDSLSDLPAVANSKFTANRYCDRYSIRSTVIYPIIAPEDYQVQVTGNAVTFVNPDVRKGLEIAVGVAAACPDIPFLFVDGWPMAQEMRQALADRLSALGNVTYSKPVPDMREIYRQTRLLLAPSQWEEGYGRVATEAQLSGIPVVGSARGGLSEAIGSGGLILEADDPIDKWIEAVRSLWDDHQAYERLSAAAREHATRVEVQPAKQISLWEAAITAAASHSDSAKAAN